MQRGESHSDFKFGTFIGHFSSDGAPSKAVKGLIFNSKGLSVNNF